ncbi:MAG: FadR/GntR family transcriptional regulator [bacterium]
MAPTRTSDELAAHLRQRIRSGEIPVGSRLPSQRDLAAHLEISRQSVQEALAVLEFEGYVETRRGAQGGSFVREPETSEEFWVERLRATILDLDEALDYRLAIERQVSILAAERRCDADVERMRESIDAIPVGESDPAPRRQRFRQADSAFHIGLAQAAGNVRLLRAVREVRAELFILTDRIPYVETREATRAEHLAICDAIADRDGDAAAEAISLHIDETREDLHAIVEGRWPR